MKTRFLLMLLSIALLAGAAQANMLVNSSFEDGAFAANDPPAGWMDSSSSYTSNMTWINNATGAHSGNKFIRMYNWWTSDSTHYDAYLGTPVLGVQEGEEYVFSIWAKTVTPGTNAWAKMNIDWYSTTSVLTSYAAGYIGGDSVRVGTVGNDWCQIDFGSLIAPEGAVAAEFSVTGDDENNPSHPNTTNAVGVYYDDVSMIGPDPEIDAGDDMISWDGNIVDLTGSTELIGYSTITWSAEPAVTAITGGDTLTPSVEIDLPSSDMVTYTLTLDIDSKYDLMKIDVYADACQAAIAAGENSPADIAGDDCLITLADFAELASKWLLDYKLTEEAIKP